MPATRPYRWTCSPTSGVRPQSAQLSRSASSAPTPRRSRTSSSSSISRSAGWLMVYGVRHTRPGSCSDPIRPHAPMLVRCSMPVCPSAGRPTKHRPVCTSQCRGMQTLWWFCSQTKTSDTDHVARFLISELTTMVYTDTLVGVATSSSRKLEVTPEFLPMSSTLGNPEVERGSTGWNRLLRALWLARGRSGADTADTC